MNGKQMFFHMLRNGEFSPPRIRNLLQGLLSQRLGLRAASNRPSILMIEPTNLCNLKCPLCPTGNESLTAPRGHLALGDFEQILDEMSPFLLNLTLWNYGEPFLNKDIFAMISYAREQRVFVRLSTNGHCFQEEDIRNRLIESDLDNLIISLDGASQETFLRYRREGDFGAVVDNISRIVQEKKKRGRRNPYIEIQFILMKHNEHEVPKMRQLGRTLEVDQVKLKTVNLELGPSEASTDTIQEFLPRADRHSRYRVEEGKLRIKRPTPGCRRLWLSSVVNWDGSVSPCCYDPNRHYVLGNAFQKGLLAVWNSEEYANFREALMRDKAGIPMCRNCTGKVPGLDIGAD